MRLIRNMVNHETNELFLTTSKCPPRTGESSKEIDLKQIGQRDTKTPLA